MTERKPRHPGFLPDSHVGLEQWLGDGDSGLDLTVLARAMARSQPFRSDALRHTEPRSESLSTKTPPLSPPEPESEALKRQAGLGTPFRADEHIETQAPHTVVSHVDDLPAYAGAHAVDDLLAVNFHCYAGRRDFNRPFRILVFGGENRDSLLRLHYQTRDLPATTLLCADPDDGTLQGLAEHLKNTGIQRSVGLRHVSLFDTALPALGRFDFIYYRDSGFSDLSTDLALGLRQLNTLLAPGGALALILPGEIARTATRPLQDLLRLVNNGEADRQRRLANARLLLANLPSENLYCRMVDRQAIERRATRENDGNAGIPGETDDLAAFLLDETEQHLPARTFTAECLEDAFEMLGLRGIFVDPLRRRRLETARLAELPFSRRIRSRIAALSPREHSALMEWIWPDAVEHRYWVVDRTAGEMDTDDDEVIPFFSPLVNRLPLPAFLGGFDGNATLLGINAAFAEILSSDQRHRLSTPAAAVIFPLCDGTRSLRTLCAVLCERFPGKSPELLRRELNRALKTAADFDIIRFRHTQSAVSRLHALR